MVKPNTSAMRSIDSNCTPGRFPLSISDKCWGDIPVMDDTHDKVRRLELRQRLSVENRREDMGERYRMKDRINHTHIPIDREITGCKQPHPANQPKIRKPDLRLGRKIRPHLFHAVRDDLSVDVAGYRAPEHRRSENLSFG